MTATAQNKIGGLSLIIGTSLVVVMLSLTPGCLVSLVFVAVVSPLHGLAGSFFTLFAVAVLLGNAWLIMLGIGLYKGMPELSKTPVSV